VALCGHATLASSFIIFNKLQWAQDVIHFQTRKNGILSVKRNGELLEMDFPAQPPSKQAIPDGLANGLNHSFLEVLGTDKDLLVLLENEDAVRELKPKFSLLERIEKQGIIVTAPGQQCDFVSRYFAPRVGVPEDPATGSSHCVLAPFWSKRLGKKKLYARQVSKRGGELFCEDRGDRVSIAGKAVLYLEGMITI
jgi:PhzF family phenazine biosynthesis protein